MTNSDDGNGMWGDEERGRYPTRPAKATAPSQYDKLFKVHPWILIYMTYSCVVLGGVVAMQSGVGDAGRGNALLSWHPIIVHNIPGWTGPLALWRATPSSSPPAGVRRVANFQPPNI